MSTSLKPLDQITVKQGAYFQDLLFQPQAIEKTLDWLGRENRWSKTSEFFKSCTWRRIILTGMGSSFHALHPLNLSLIAAGHTPVMMETSELIHYGMSLCDEKTLIVAVSQSGQSAEILRLLEENTKSKLIGVTNTEDGPLAARADLSLITQAGDEFSVSCKTYVAGMLALQWLAASIVGAEDEAVCMEKFATVAGGIKAYLKSWRTHCEVLADKLQGMNHLFFVGRGYSLAAVGTGGLITKEADHFHAEGMSSAAFRHGPMEMLQPDMFTVVFNGAPRTASLNHRLMEELTTRGVACAEIGPATDFAPFRLPDSDQLLQPIFEILPVEMITLALAALTNREAGFFEFATKITATE